MQLIKTGITGRAESTTEHKMDGLRKGMIDRHLIRNRGIELMFSKIDYQIVGNIRGHLQRAGKTTDITQRPLP